MYEITRYYMFNLEGLLGNGWFTATEIRVASDYDHTILNSHLQEDPDVFHFLFQWCQHRRGGTLQQKFNE